MTTDVLEREEELEEISEEDKEALKEDPTLPGRAKVMEIVTRRDYNRLVDRKYTLLDKIGEGQTRNTAQVLYVNGDVKKVWALKVPKREINRESICTEINRSKKDLEEAELEALKELSHPYVALIMDSFRLGDGRRVNVEDLVDGSDLESLGKINDESKLLKYALQAAQALKYIHENGMVHRDIKPSNIVVGSKGDIKITDFQNAALIRDISDQMMPTRGGTAYTYPELLNSLVGGPESSASRRTDIFALGGVIYHMITGNDPFKYKIEHDENGKEIQVGKEKFKIRLRDGDNKIDQITKEQHEKNLKKALKRVPNEWKKPLYRMLTVDDKKQIYWTSQVTENLEDMQEGFGKKLRKSIVTGAKWAMAAAAAVGLGGLLTLSAIKESKREPVPTLQDLMNQNIYANFSLQSQEDERMTGYRNSILRPYWNKIEKILPVIEKDKEKMQTIQRMGGRSSESVGVPKRLSYSMILASFIGKNTQDYYQNSNEERLYPGYVSRGFVVRARSGPIGRVDELDDIGKLGQANLYLKNCIGEGRDVADVFAEFYTSSKDTRAAIVRSRSLRYFPYITDKSDSGFISGHSIKCGYNMAIDQMPNDLIKTAVALYLITDEEGKVDLKKIPKRAPEGLNILQLNLPESDGIPRY